MSYYETNLARANSYYRVTRAFDVQELTGHRPGNHYYGSARIHDPVYAPLTVKSGGVILNLIGGLFYADAPGAPCRPVVLAVNEKSPFEKRYFPDRHDWPLDALEPIAAAEYVRVP